MLESEIHSQHNANHIGGDEEFKPPVGPKSFRTRGHFRGFRFGRLREAVPMKDTVDQSSLSEKPATREINSMELLRGQSEILIRHGEEIYRLKQTRNGKLILQK